MAKTKLGKEDKHWCIYQTNRYHKKRAYSKNKPVFYEEIEQIC